MTCAIDLEFSVPCWKMIYLPPSPIPNAPAYTPMTPYTPPYPIRIPQCPTSPRVVWLCFCFDPDELTFLHCSTCTLSFVVLYLLNDGSKTGNVVSICPSHTVYETIPLRIKRTQSYRTRTDDLHRLYDGFVLVLSPYFFVWIWIDSVRVFIVGK